MRHSLRYYLCTAKLFLMLYTLPLLVCLADMICNRNYIVDTAALLVFAAAVLVLIGHLRIQKIGRNVPEIPFPSLDKRERNLLRAVRIIIVVAGAAAVTISGRGMFSFWTIVSVIIDEILSVLAVQQIRIDRMGDLIIKSFENE